jgi:hypothetical protein
MIVRPIVVASMAALKVGEAVRRAVRNYGNPRVYRHSAYPNHNGRRRSSGASAVASTSLLPALSARFDVTKAIDS